MDMGYCDFCKSEHNKEDICKICDENYCNLYDGPLQQVPLTYTVNNDIEYGEFICDECIERVKTMNVIYDNDSRDSSDSEYNDSSVEEHTPVSAKNSSIRREKRGRECEFNIESKDILDLLIKQDYKCNYSGIKLTFETNNNYKISLDRINSTKGYTKDNIQIVAHIVNVAKSNLTKSQFLEMVEQI